MLTVPFLTVIGCNKSTDPNVLRIATAGKDMKPACIIIAQHLGYFEEEGITVEFVTASGLHDGLVAVDMGKLDIMPYGIISQSTFVSQGTDVVLFSGTVTEGGEIITLPENAKSLDTLEKFRNKRIGCYRMETGQMVLRGLLRDAGFDLEKDVEFIYMGSFQIIIESVQKGTIDMGVLSSGGGYIALQAGLAVAGRVGDWKPGFPCCRMSTSRETFNKKRESLVAFQIANLRAYDIFLNDRQKAITTLMEFSGQPEDYVTAVLFGLEGIYESAMIISLDPCRNKIIEFYETMKKNGDIDKNTPYDIADHIDGSVYTDALKELIRRGDNPSLYQRLLDEYDVNNR